jgi:hypothetical protein
MWRLQLREFSSYLEYPAPTWADVEQILRRLDGFRHDDALLEYAGGTADEAWLILGGGEAARVVVSVQTAGADHPLHLLDPVRGDELEIQSVGEQETPLPGKFYVPLEMALQAARYFYRHRAPDPTLRWAAPNFEEGA